jgi:hypothetical protein
MLARESCEWSQCGVLRKEGLSLSLYRCTALTVAEKVTEIFGQHSLFLIIHVLLLLL